MQRNAHEYELTAHISLACLDPTALAGLRMSGRCTIQIPEAVFDLSHPCHYFRRIKALSVAVVCAARACGSVSLRVTQTSSRIRVGAGHGPWIASDSAACIDVPIGGQRFGHDIFAVQSTASVRDRGEEGPFGIGVEDECPLRFEGRGVVGTYVMQLSQAFQSFDYGSISDVVLRFRYTARDGVRCSGNPGEERPA